MGVLIDASILIEAERGRLDLGMPPAQLKDEEFFLSVITASELLQGVHRTDDAAVGARRSVWVEAILARFPLLPVELGGARIHARLWAELARQGRPIGPNDLWLAAQALASGLTMLTANLREFERVPGLAVRRWS